MDNLFGNNNKKISWVQICFLLCIVILTACIFAVLAANRQSIVGYTIGIPLFTVGVISAIIALIKRRTLKGSVWLISDAAATAVLSVFLIANSDISLYILPLCFGLWEASLGIFKICEACQLKKENVSNHRGFFFIGIAEIVSGIIFLIRPVDEALGYGTAITLTLIIQMSAYALRYYCYGEMTRSE